MLKNRIEFISKITKELLERGCYLSLENEETVKFRDWEGVLVTCSGYFGVGVLKVAIKRRIWFWILLHEYCHFLQWIDKDEIYIAYENVEEHVSIEIEGNKKQRENALRALQMVEYDCERRVVRLLLNNKLSINVNSYIKKANAYIMFYSILIKTGKWYDIAPYDVNEIVEMMPTKFIRADELWEDYEKLVMEYCYKKDNKCQ